MEIDRQFANASMEQCYGFLGCAGQIAANVFASGQKEIVLRVGNWAADDPQHFVPGYNKEYDVVLLDAVVEQDPCAIIPGVEPEADPFGSPLYHMVIGEGHDQRARSIAETFDVNHLSDLSEQAPVSVKFKHSDPFYSISKTVANFFGVVLQKGGTEMGARLMKGPPETEIVTIDPVWKEKKDENGERIWAYRKDAAGNDLKDKVGNRIKSHVLQEIKVPGRQETVQFVPIHLVIDKADGIKLEDVTSIRSFESAYDPTWVLSDLLTGVYKGQKPFQSDGSER